jgi:hypothetical protein
VRTTNCCCCWWRVRVRMRIDCIGWSNAWMLSHSPRLWLCDGAVQTCGCQILAFGNPF